MVEDSDTGEDCEPLIGFTAKGDIRIMAGGPTDAMWTGPEEGDEDDYDPFGT